MSTQGQWLGSWAGRWFGAVAQQVVEQPPTNTGGSSRIRGRKRRRIWPELPAPGEPFELPPDELPLQPPAPLLPGQPTVPMLPCTRPARRRRQLHQLIAIGVLGRRR